MIDLFTKQEKVALGFLIGVSLIGIILFEFLGRPPVSQVPFVRLVVHVNHASSEELAALPGIGPVLAERIVQDRGQHGRYMVLEDLSRVKGVSSKLLQRMKDLIQFD